MIPSVQDKIALAAAPDKCLRCGDCEAACPSSVFSWREGELDVHHPGRCILCGHCAAVCPVAAFSHSKLPMEEFGRLDAGQGPSAAAIRRLFAMRRSCRRFLDEPLERGEIESLIDMARFAPTSTNSQNVRCLLFSGREAVSGLGGLTARYYLKLHRQLENPFVRLALAATVGMKTVTAYRFRMPSIVEMFEKTLAGEDRLFYRAPAVIVLFASGLSHLASAGCNLAAMELLLGAEAMGLGACYNGYALTALVRDRKTRAAAGIPRTCMPGAVIAVGKPAGRFFRVPPRNVRRVIDAGAPSET